MLTPFTFDRLLDAADCDRVIALASDGAFGEAGLVRGERNADVRRARIAWFDEAGAAGWLFDRLLDAFAAANRAQFGFDLEGFDERMQVAWYGAAMAGHFDWHVDLGDGKLAQKRKLTLVAQLSDGESYDGGDLEINADGRPRPALRARGAAVLFPAFTPHRVTPVTMGERYSLTLWAHGPALR